MPDSPEPAARKYNTNLVVSAVVVLALAVTAGVGWLLPLLAFEDWAVRGTFGDAFGAANAILSALALGGVVWAIFLQRDDLRMQNLALQETRDEVAKQAQALDSQLAAMQQQNFEATFFHLLGLQREIVADMIVRHLRVAEDGSLRRELQREPFRGRGALRALALAVEHAMSIRSRTRAEDILSGAAGRYVIFHEDAGHHLAHYYRNMAEILRLVRHDYPKGVAADTYASVVRAQLSTHETILLLHYVMVGPGSDYLVDDVVRFDLLCNVPELDWYAGLLVEYRSLTAGAPSRFSWSELFDPQVDSMT